ncbi:MAG: YfiR family protein [Gammaproteobacteria bacterium]|nr:YfiR family protein [Gammaproteobacteria bacterium]
MIPTPWLSASSVARAESILAKEYFVKAAFIYNFARLVEWPDKAYNSNNNVFKLCLIGEDPFGKALQTIENKKVVDRLLFIQKLKHLENVSQCQILFISSSEQQLPKLLNTVKQYPILTVSDLPDFAERGGQIHFFLNDSDKLNLKVNLEVIKQAGLEISSRILVLSEIVSTRGDTQP